MSHGLTVAEALAAFRSANGITAAADSAPTWACRLGPLTLRLPNLRWRRAAILRHDLHHLLTGYPCSLRGECQMATWEFAAGRFPHPGATLFCLPLVAAGLLWSPRAIWRAFLAGRGGRSLYGAEVTDTVLRLPVDRLKAETASPTRKRRRIADAIAFGALILQSVAVVVLPVAAGVLLVLAV